MSNFATANGVEAVPDNVWVLKRQTICYEAGADAMLAALKGSGGSVAIGDSWASINLQIHQGSIGTIVFIPDEKA